MKRMSSLFSDTADRIFAAAGSHRDSDFDVSVWSAIEEVGLDWLLLREEAGGAGDAFEDAVASARSFGAHAPVIPFVETLVANWCLDQAGLDVPSGAKSVLVPLPNEAMFGTSPSTGVTFNWVLPETKLVTVAAAGVDRSVVTLVEVRPSGANRSNLAGEPFLVGSLAEFASLPGSKGHMAKGSGHVLALLATMKAAAIVGSLETALAMTIDYANVRKQFGRRIGAFQAVQHMIARMSEETAAAAAALEKAARSLGRSNGLFAAAIAKARASDAAGPVAAMAHQCHGAIGFTREHALHRFTTRALSWRDDAGDADYWHGRIGAAVLRIGSGGVWGGITEGSLM
jgi:acyl-CoA dehydrogenase